MQTSLPPSIKRKSSPEIPHSKRPKYAKSYRVRGVPLDWDEAKLHSFLLEDRRFMDPSIKSLAREVHGKSKTATITLAASSTEVNWVIKIPDSTSNYGQLTFDTDFHGLTTLYAPLTSHEIDVIAISGIGGHAFGSFKERGGDHMWLRDSLPTDLTLNIPAQPIARISICGYESTIPDSNNTQELEDLATKFHGHLLSLANIPTMRPIILIAHSLGGLVVQKVLITLSKSRIDDDSKLLRAISGIVFFGVPQAGMDITWLLPMAPDGPNRPLIDSINLGSRILAQQRREFRNCLEDHDIDVFCFYETYLSPETPIKDERGCWMLGEPRKLLVDKPSATDCGTGPENECAIARTHSEMVKFGPNDDIYDIVRDRLLALVRKLARPNTSQDAFDSQLTSTRRQQLIDLLLFDQIDERINTVKEHAKDTCSWIRETPQYVSWRDLAKQTEHHGFWWIRGKPGAGKSVLMKYLYKNSKKTIRGAKVISFFFNARGDILERSTLGLYRSLLFQIFKLIPDLEVILNSLGTYQTRTIEREGWQIQTLQDTLLQSVKRLGSHRLVCYIDALDECPEQEVREMIRFFERVGEKAISHKTHLNICFSSRYYPHITINAGLKMELEHQKDHEADIEHYIDTELRIHQSKYAADAKKGIMEKASGVFLWVALVIPMLNEAFDHGNIRAFKRRLQELPASLSDLFFDILQRDAKDKDALLCCIQWVLFSKSQLDLVTLHAAINIALEDDLDEWNQEDITDEIMHRYIISVSKGLVEQTISKTPKMQFIHESVRDFLLKETGFQKLWPELSTNFEAKGHQSLAHYCYKQITTTSRSNIRIPYPLPPAAELELIRAKFSSSFPFLKHAVDNILYHSNVAQEHGESQSQFIQDFPKNEWIRYHNLFEKFQTRHYPENISLLYIFAELDLLELVRLLPDRQRHLDLNEGRYGKPLLAALAYGSKKVARELGLQVFIDQGVLQTSDRTYDTYFNALKANVYFSPKKKEIEVCLVEFNCYPAVSALISQGMGLQHGHYSGRTLLMWAVVFGAREVAEMLLEEGSDIEATDKDGQTPLVLASAALASAAASLYTSAVVAAAEIVKLLVDKGANIEAKDKDGQTPLVLAAAAAAASIYTSAAASAAAAVVAAAAAEIVKLLVDKGANIEAKDKDGQTPLVLASAAAAAAASIYISAAAAAAAEIVKLLVDKGANIEVKDKDGQTPLVLQQYQNEARQ